MKSERDERGTRLRAATTHPILLSLWRLSLISKLRRQPLRSRGIEQVAWDVWVEKELWKKKLQSNLSGLANEKSCLAPAWLTQRNTFDLFFVKRFKNSDVNRGM
jgi:hypothetical protein